MALVGLNTGSSEELQTLPDPSAIVWDLDGTLVESAPDLAKALKEVVLAEPNTARVYKSWLYELDTALVEDVLMPNSELDVF